MLIFIGIIVIAIGVKYIIEGVEAIHHFTNKNGEGAIGITRKTFSKAFIGLLLIAAGGLLMSMGFEPDFLSRIFS